MDDKPTAPQKQLTLLDSTSLIVGIIVGAGVYQMSPDIAKGAHHGWGVLAIWALGGLISLCGAFGYAELGSAFPKQGGDFVYLSRAYGRWAGFLFGWLQLAIVRPADIVVMAFAFAMYARAIYDPFPGSGHTQQVYAAAAVIVFTAINVIGVRQGKLTQNLLTAAKALGLLAIVAVALLATPAEAADAPFEPLDARVALVFVLFCFGGWNEMAYVAAEVKNPEKNILRALVLGIAGVTLLYLLVNAAFLYTLGYRGMATSTAVAADAVSTVFPRTGAGLISALICISALGAVNGIIFTGARISYAVGAEHPLFRFLGGWSPKTGTPVRALAVQGILALLLIAFLQNFVKTVLAVAPTVYIFYIATSLAVIVLRWREPETDRPYRVTGYPLTTLIFIAVCGRLIYSTIDYTVNEIEKPWIVLVPFAIMLLGLPLYALSNTLAKRSA